MLIFNKFKSRGHAERFAEMVALKFGRLAGVYDSQEVSNCVNSFRSELAPPIVLVSRRSDYSDEDQIRELATHFNGTFAGT
jgi:hypothetical protein